MIVRSCVNNAARNANTPLGYNMSFFRSRYNIDVLHSNVRQCIKLIVSPTLGNDQFITLHQLKSLISVRSGLEHIPGFTMKEVIRVINAISKD